MTVQELWDCLTRIPDEEPEDLFLDWSMRDILAAISQVRDWFKVTYAYRPLFLVFEVIDPIWQLVDGIQISCLRFWTLFRAQVRTERPSGSYRTFSRSHSKRISSLMIAMAQSCELLSRPVIFPAHDFATQLASIALLTAKGVVVHRTSSIAISRI